ncbi:hypothetical protein OU790_18130, partial [Ruegeria sp. NA]
FTGIGSLNLGSTEFVCLAHGWMGFPFIPTFSPTYIYCIIWSAPEQPGTININDYWDLQN